MEVRAIKLCGTFDEFLGIQAVLSYGSTRQDLTSFGNTENCDEWVIPQGSFIKRIQLKYNKGGIKYIKMSTEKGVNFERGRWSTLDNMSSMEFEENQPLVGFVGYATDNLLHALGYYRYKCMVPHDAYTDDDVNDDTGIIDEGEGEDIVDEEETRGSVTEE